MPLTAPGDRSGLALLRPQRTLLLAGLTGASTGLAVAAFEIATRDEIFERVIEAPLAVQAAALGIGLALAAASLAWLAGGASPATSDAYIANFHTPGRPLPMRPALGRIAAGVATLGSGGALGFEGPSLYIGAIIGTAIQTRVPRMFSRDDGKVLMVAGAAAGVAAIFKAPATGAVFALEVPYRDDTARRLLLPALVGAASGYLAFVALMGTAPLFEVDGAPPFDLRELGGAVALGLICGIGARGFAWLIGLAKRATEWHHPAVRVVAAGAFLATLLVTSAAVFGEGLSNGSGYRVLEWLDQSRAIHLVLILLAMRVAAAAATIAGGGVGGIFIPLVIAGVLVGEAMSSALSDTSNVFPLVGAAAFLGAGYRTPLAGVMFVAETTGRPGFVVPGLIASVASQLVMGNASVSPYQSSRRGGHLERRLQLPIADAIDSDVRTVPPDATLDELHAHLRLTREVEVPVVDGARYAGMTSLHELQQVPSEEWSDRTVAGIVDASWPVATPYWTLRQAIAAMEDADVDSLPVVDGDTFIGVTTTDGILRLDEILGEDPPPPA